MSDRFRKISSLRIRKGYEKNNPFYLEVSTAYRIDDWKRGLLLQHLRKLHGSLSQQAPGFFIKEEDLPKLIKILNQLLEEKSADFSSSTRGLIANLFQKNGEKVDIADITEELKKLEKKLTSKHQAELTALKRQLSDKDKEISSLSLKLEKARQQRQKIRILEMERSIPLFRKQLKEFNRLVDNGKDISKEKGVKQETLYQVFLKENFWMFGVEYISVKSKPKSDVNREPDLLLQRADGFNDVVELENPTDNLFIEKSNRREQSKELKESLAQTMDYLDDYARRYPDVYYQDEIETYKPKGIIVIGRSGEKDSEKSPKQVRDLRRSKRQLNSYLHGIEIWTYDDLMLNAERVIELLERGPSKQRE